MRRLIKWLVKIWAGKPDTKDIEIHMDIDFADPEDDMLLYGVYENGIITIYTQEAYEKEFKTK